MLQLILLSTVFNVVFDHAHSSKIRRFGVEDLGPVRLDILPSEALEGEKREGGRDAVRYLSL